MYQAFYFDYECQKNRQSIIVDIKGKENIKIMSFRQNRTCCLNITAQNKVLNQSFYTIYENKSFMIVEYILIIGKRSNGKFYNRFHNEILMMGQPSSFHQL